MVNDLKVGRAVRAVASWVCWALAVAIGTVTAGGFISGGIPCSFGTARSCPPQTAILLLGVALAVAFGVLGAVLWRPKPPKPPSSPWPWR